MEHLPKIEPITREQIQMDLGHVILKQAVKVSQPSPTELEDMLELAEELPLERGHYGINTTTKSN